MYDIYITDYCWPLLWQVIVDKKRVKNMNLHVYLYIPTSIILVLIYVAQRAAVNGLYKSQNE